MTRAVSSAYYAKLQQSTVTICELIELSSKTREWRWATSETPVTFGGNTYDPFPGFTPSGVDETIDLGIATVNFVMANSGGEFNELLDTYGLDLASLQVRRVFTDTPDLGSMIIYAGKLGDYSYDRNQISGEARNIFHGINVNWPYYSYQDQCSWKFGSTGCGVDTSSITIIGSLNASSDKINFTVASGFFTASYANGYFLKGKLTILDGQNSGEVRTIRIHSGDGFSISHQLPFNVDSNDGFSLYPGCRKRFIADCVSKYNASSNFLGFPWIPRQGQAF